MSEADESARALYMRIRDVLLKEWDPIGIQAFTEAQDEYDEYVPTIRSMLISRKPISDVLEYLLWVESQHMGLAPDKQRTQVIAERLIKLVDMSV